MKAYLKKIDKGVKVMMKQLSLSFSVSLTHTLYTNTHEIKKMFNFINNAVKAMPLFSPIKLTNIFL